MNNQQSNTIEQVALQALCWFLVVSTFMTPSFKLPGFWFSIRLEDILLPVLGIWLLIRKKIVFDKYLLIVGIFMAYIFFTIFWNDRLKSASDYFEIYKLIKYLVFFLFFRYAFENINVSKMIDVVFVLLLVFNLFQYTGIFGFNEIIEPYFASGPHLKFFGLDSLGQPSTKRMLGTMGNPNVNAILFLFFFSWYLSQINKSIRNKIFFYLALLSIIACQSRTGLIAVILIVIADILYSRAFYLKSLKLVHVLVIVAVLTLILAPQQFSFNFAITSNTKYLSSFTHHDITQTGSVKGRMEVWNHLFNMIKEKPFIGHGPFKEYFYDNELYSESEYVLTLWRYGLIGLLIYLSWILSPLLLSIKQINKKAKTLRPLFLFTMAILISAITNNPLVQPQILIMFAFMTALFYSSQNEKV